jgi:hypothetical protein
MAELAHVLSIPAVRDFQAALRRFRQELALSCETLTTEIQRGVAWIEYDRPAYWSAQTRKAFDGVAETRTRLNTCQLRTVAGRRPSCIEEKQAYEQARRRLQHCQEQVRRVQQWALKIHRESDEFRGRMARVRRLLDSDLPQMDALLERTLNALEGYAGMTAPAPAEVTPADESAPASGTAGGH